MEQELCAAQNGAQWSPPQCLCRSPTRLQMFSFQGPLWPLLLLCTIYKSSYAVLLFCWLWIPPWSWKLCRRESLWQPLQMWGQHSSHDSVKVPLNLCHHCPWKRINLDWNNLSLQLRVTSGKVITLTLKELQLGCFCRNRSNVCNQEVRIWFFFLLLDGGLQWCGKVFPYFQSFHFLHIDTFTSFRTSYKWND